MDIPIAVVGLADGPVSAHFEESQAYTEGGQNWPEWLRQNLARPWIEEQRDPANDDDKLFEIRRGWQRKMNDAGYLGMDWPREWGGRGATAVEKAIFTEETYRADTPPIPNPNHHPHTPHPQRGGADL